MDFEIVSSLDDIPAADWNRLAGADNPFVRHEFLAALERHDCVGAKHGWRPRHALVRDDSRRLLGAAPQYEKYNSYGEFVFDWSWADAYDRAGGRYYPKLVCAVPYTPASGPRLIVAPGEPRAGEIRHALRDGSIAYAHRRNMSSVHWLFTPPPDTEDLVHGDVFRRTGCQYHWFNRGYRDFDDFLSRFTSKRRKQIRRERRQVKDAGVEIEILTGRTATAMHWDIYDRFYRSTFDRKWGYATLTREFFAAIAQSLGDAVLLVLGRQRGRYVAGALCLQGTQCLFGRHWGCDVSIPGLHFEVCYYATIEHSIEHGLARFEAGAQGEHKLARGFVPVPTYSAHWIADEAFSTAVRRFTEQEHLAIEAYREELNGRLPYNAKAPSELDETISIG